MASDYKTDHYYNIDYPSIDLKKEVKLSKKLNIVVDIKISSLIMNG